MTTNHEDYTPRAPRYCRGCNTYRVGHFRHDRCGTCYQQMRRKEGVISGLVDVEDSVRHITALLAAGWRRNEICRAAGIDNGMYHRMMTGLRARCQEKTELAILGIDPNTRDRYMRTVWQTRRANAARRKAEDEQAAAARRRSRKIREDTQAEREAALREALEAEQHRHAKDADMRSELWVHHSARESGLAWDTEAPIGLEAVEDPDTAQAVESAWKLQALCAQVDPEIFFPEKGGSTKEAKRICAMCPVKRRCLEEALKGDERFGIWGGMSERERRKLTRPETYGYVSDERLAELGLDEEVYA